MKGWVPALAELAAAGKPAVLVTVLKAEGSTPREAGAKMVITAEGASGSIGGGHLELVATEEARALLLRAAAGEDLSAPVLRELALGPSLGQCCGGRTTLLLEVVLAPRWQVAIFGAGHVGKGLVRVLSELPCAVIWIDSRPEELPATPPPSVRCLVSERPAEEVAELPAGADLLVMTHSHAHDLEIVDAALRRGAHRFLGLIGSRTKRATFASRLEARGRTAAQIASITCPIGLADIAGKEPAVIAVSVAAQLLQLRAAGAPPPASAPTSGEPD